MSIRSANAPVAHAFYAAVVQGDYRPDSVARAVGVAAATVYDWAEGRRPLPAYALPGVYRATGDVGLYAELAGARDVRLLVSEPPRVEAPSVVDVRAGANRVTIAIGKLLEDLERDLADGVFDDTERDRHYAAIDEAVRRLEEHRQRVEHAPRPLRRSAK